MASKVNLTEAELEFLKKLSAHRRGLPGPPPEYQGDLVNCTGPELKKLMEAKMVGRRKLAHPRSTDGHPQNPIYLKQTHRYRILKAGRALLSSGKTGE